MLNRPLQRVVVTGLGTISPVGNNPQQAFENLCSGKSGIEVLRKFNTEGCPSRIGGTVKDFAIRDTIQDREALRMARLMEPTQQWALAAAEQAIQDASFDFANADPNRFGIYLGNGLAGRDQIEIMSHKILNLLEEVKTQDHAATIHQMNLRLLTETNPLSFLQQCPSVITAQLAMRYKAQGPNTTVVSLCAAGAQAIGEAAWMIARGDADIMLAGSCDSMLNRLDLSAFAMLDAVSGNNDAVAGASRPFDLRRDGCVVGEGAAMLTLESLEHAQARGAKIYAELIGYGSTDDAHKISAPPEDGEGAVQSMQKALNMAGLAPYEIDHINAHGTSTRLNDKTETIAIKRVFGEHAYQIPVISSKSMTGHMIAAAGAFEALVSVMSLQQQKIPPTLNLETPDANCDLDYVPAKTNPNGRELPNLKTALSNSFAIGGVNATLIFHRGVRP